MAYLLSLDDQQSRILRITADDHNLTVSEYVQTVLVDAELIPPPMPTEEDLVDYALALAEGHHPSASMVHQLRLREGELVSQLLAIRTGLLAVDRPEVAEVPLSESEDVEDVVDDNQDVPVSVPTPRAKSFEPTITAFEEPEKEPEQEEPEEPEEPEEDEGVEDIVQWLKSWQDGNQAPHPRRKPGGPRVLTPNDARAIMHVLRTGKLRQREIAQAFGCSRSLISKIKNGRAWGSVV